MISSIEFNIDQVVSRQIIFFVSKIKIKFWKLFFVREMWSRHVLNTWAVEKPFVFISKFNSPPERRFQRTRNRRADLAIRCRAYSWIEAHFSSSSSSSYRSSIPNYKIRRAPPIDIPFAALRICSRYVIAPVFFFPSRQGLIFGCFETRCAC